MERAGHDGRGKVSRHRRLSHHLRAPGPQKPSVHISLPARAPLSPERLARRSWGLCRLAREWSATRRAPGWAGTAPPSTASGWERVARTQAMACSQGCWSVPLAHLMQLLWFMVACKTSAAATPAANLTAILPTPVPPRRRPARPRPPGSRSAPCLARCDSSAPLPAAQGPT